MALVHIVGAQVGGGERLRELARYRELVANLTARDLKLKYKGSVLGVAWSLLNPILMMAIYTVVFSVFLRAVRVPNYWALILTGILPWTFFATSVNGAATSFVRNPSLISKVYFPVEALPLSVVLANFVNLLIPMPILLGILLVAGVHLGPSLILLPILLLANLALMVGLGLAIAAITVHFRDLEHLALIGVQALFYLTPVLYPLDPAALPAGAARFIPYVKLNPMSWYLEAYHTILFYGRWPDAVTMSLVVASALLALTGGYAFFVRLRSHLPEAI